MTLKTHPWDPVDYLETPEDMVTYLEAAIEDGDPLVIALAIRDVARAKGIDDLATSNASSDVGTFLRAIKALGLEVAFKQAA